MIHVTLLAIVAAATPREAPSARVFLKPPAAAVRACQATPADGGLVSVALFSPASAACPVASVAGDEIPLRDLAEALEFGHMTRRPGRAASKGMNFTPALDRLIATRLLVQEAHEMRLEATPEFSGALDDFKASRQRAMVQKIAVRGVKPDAAEVERLYRDAVREWKLKSVLLEKEADAKALEAALQKGEKFDALVKRYLAEKKAKGAEKAEFVAPKHMLPEVLAAVVKAKPGVPTGLVKVPSGWAVLRVDGTRYPKDPAARASARETAQARAEHQAVRRFYEGAVKRYATVDEALLASLDFEKGGEKGFEALLQDPRPLVTIRGDKPVTVADLTREIGMKFFHGLDGPIREKKVNPQKTECFERLVGSRLFAKEAASRKLDRDPQYRREVEEYERALAFSTVVEKAIAPEVKVTEDEATQYYEQHKAEYSAPEMFKLDGVAFASPREAQAALDKLGAGTDFAWLRSSAPGQLDPDHRSLHFDGSTVSASTLAPELRKALTGASAGAYRLYALGPAEVYVVRVVERRAPEPQPYVEAREKIAKKLYNEKLTQAIADYAGKLRKVQKVDVFITRVSL
jgi:parvulin-like peptidyl-prolyl isomerase